MAITRAQQAMLEKLVKHKYYATEQAFIDDEANVGEYDVCFVKNGNAGYISTRNMKFGEQSSIQGDITDVKDRVSALEKDNTTNKDDIKALKADKVDKKEGYSLVLDTQISKLEGLSTQTEINNSISEAASTASANLATAKGELQGKIEANTTSINAVSGRVATLEGKKFVELGTDDLIPASVLPSYVDDVLEYASLSALESATNAKESGKIYVTLDTNKTYRWSGSAYVEISASIALGETSSTAYAGDKGKKNAEDIAALQDTTTKTNSTVTAINGRLETAEATITTHGNDINSLKSAVNTNETSITNLSDKVSANANSISAVQATANANAGKLGNIEDNAQVNVIEKIKVNNTELSVSSKTVELTVPTSVSQLDNDSKFITMNDLNEDLDTLDALLQAACWVD
jgi:chromosome segregation ATPase